LVRLAIRDATQRQATLEVARAWIQTAAEFQVPVVRFFAARNPLELDLKT
jgi:hypothetical protein